MHVKAVLVVLSSICVASAFPCCPHCFLFCLRVECIMSRYSIFCIVFAFVLCLCVCVCAQLLIVGFVVVVFPCVFRVVPCYVNCCVYAAVLL